MFWPSPGAERLSYLPCSRSCSGYGWDGMPRTGRRLENGQSSSNSSSAKHSTRPSQRVRARRRRLVRPREVRPSDFLFCQGCWRENSSTRCKKDPGRCLWQLEKREKEGEALSSSGEPGMMHSGGASPLFWTFFERWHAPAIARSLARVDCGANSHHLHTPLALAWSWRPNALATYSPLAKGRFFLTEVPLCLSLSASRLFLSCVCLALPVTTSSHLAVAPPKMDETWHGMTRRYMA